MNKNNQRLTKRRLLSKHYYKQKQEQVRQDIKDATFQAFYFDEFIPLPFHSYEVTTLNAAQFNFIPLAFEQHQMVVFRLPFREKLPEAMFENFRQLHLPQYEVGLLIRINDYELGEAEDDCISYKFTVIDRVIIEDNFLTKHFVDSQMVTVNSIVNHFSNLTLDKHGRFYLEDNLAESQDKIAVDGHYEIDFDMVINKTLRDKVLSLTARFLRMAKSEAKSYIQQLRSIAKQDELFFKIAVGLNFSDRHKLMLLHHVDVNMQGQTFIQIMKMELLTLDIQKSITRQVQVNIDKSQREYYLREQLNVIRKELNSENGEDEESKYLELLHKSSIPLEYHDMLTKEILKLNKYPFGFPEGALLRNYLDLLFELPWDVATKESLVISKARKQLDHDHYGLTKVKERILEYLAVRLLRKQSQAETDTVSGLKYQAPILCLVGPPGVGKTSIAKSIAAALKRNYVRMSLGGVRDEAEIRGHRRTYLGAMPGRFINALRQAKSNNPLILLDEIDKLGSDYRGDPASALLEILDPAQNFAFRDHFLEIPFDFSNVFFITTANSTEGIPYALLDRMEIIEVEGYTRTEKIEIANRYLLPKVMVENALAKSQLKISKSTLGVIVDQYTLEGGVRALEQQLSRICRKVAINITEANLQSVTVNRANITEYLGQPKYLNNFIEAKPSVGLVNGLAWTSFGGVMLPVEVSVMKGTGKIELTGCLGDVMKESAKVAIAYIRSQGEALGVNADFYKDSDIHIHVLDGAVPKDGPSAGITLLTALVSALTKRRVRNDVAMTGELSIRGNVLPIGGLKSKLMAALRAGVKEVYIPEQNRKDLEEMPQEVLDNLNIIIVSKAGEVLSKVLLDD